MGTVCEITADVPPNAIGAAFDEIARVESRISTWRSDSELSNLNRAPVGTPFPISSELAQLLATTSKWSARTGGAFTPLIGPLVDAWKIRAEGELAKRELVARGVALADVSKLKLDADSATRLDDIEIEEGAFGKGYAIDRAMEVLHAHGAHNVTINFGGQLAVFDEQVAELCKFGCDDPRSTSIQPQRSTGVAIADPSHRDRAAVTISIANASASTSSGSEKQFTIDGRTFTHIIDPRTGDALPPRGSVTVVSPSALDADVLSTALYVMGSDDGLRWADANGVAAIFITQDNEVLLTKLAHERLDARAVAPEFHIKD